MRINFKQFDDNTSSRYALADFLEHRVALSALHNEIWDPDTLVEVYKLQRLSVSAARKRVMQWFYRQERLHDAAIPPVKPVKLPICDLCNKRAAWQHPSGGLRCSKCPRPLK